MKETEYHRHLISEVNVNFSINRARSNYRRFYERIVFAFTRQRNTKKCRVVFVFSCTKYGYYKVHYCFLSSS